MNESRSNPGFGSTPPRYPGSFLLALREGLALAGWQPRKWLGLAVECVDAQGREQVLGLENLYRRLRSEERTQWPRLVVEMLQNVPLEAGDTTTLEEAAERILVRVGPPMSRLGDPDKEVWFQPLLGKNSLLLLDGEPYSGGRPGLDLVQELLDLIGAYERWVEAREGREERIQRSAEAFPDRRPVNALAETRRLQRLLHTPRLRGRGRGR